MWSTPAGGTPAGVESKGQTALNTPSSEYR